MINWGMCKSKHRGMVLILISIGGLALTSSGANIADPFSMFFYIMFILSVILFVSDQRKPAEKKSDRERIIECEEKIKDIHLTLIAIAVLVLIVFFCAMHNDITLAEWMTGSRREGAEYMDTGDINLTDLLNS